MVATRPPDRAVLAKSPLTEAQERIIPSQDKRERSRPVLEAKKSATNVKSNPTGRTADQSSGGLRTDHRSICLLIRTFVDKAIPRAAV
jgi:hypothetical protein